MSTDRYSHCVVFEEKEESVIGHLKLRTVDENHTATEILAETECGKELPKEPNPNTRSMGARMESIYSYIRENGGIVCEDCQRAIEQRAIKLEPGWMDKGRNEDSEFEPLNFDE